MELQILPVLTPEEVGQVLSGLSHVTFTNGKATATGGARDVKENLQAERGSTDFSALDNLIFRALQRSLRDFQMFAYPKRILAPSYARYEPGMEYGTHIDGAVMEAIPLRTDLAMTIFLSAPDSYDGGELAIRIRAWANRKSSWAPGEAVVYPATTLHRVIPVTRGALRMVAVTWIQSTVKDPRMREILYDLGRTIREAEQTSPPAANILILSKCYHNLLRYAADL